MTTFIHSLSFITFTRTGTDNNKKQHSKVAQKAEKESEMNKITKQ